mmetsp:Transcript_51909/g.150820  ORF Transcript_51909/g.150820 Transcript_51909/m.150820 type:complete len:134 (-) Transcript_51909:625-1026(-)
MSVRRLQRGICSIPQRCLPRQRRLSPWDESAVGKLPQCRRPFTSWWKRYVDGLNPDRPHAAVVSTFLRAEGIDPYLLQRDELEDMRTKYLTEFRWFAKAEDESAREEEVFELLKKKHSVVIARWKSQYSLSVE